MKTKKTKKPTPFQVYDCYEVYDYLMDKYGFTEECMQEFKDWIEKTYSGLIYPNCLVNLNLELVPKDPIVYKIFNCLIKDLSQDEFEVIITYWW